MAAVKLPVADLKLDDQEKDLIIKALGEARGNQSKAARLLGITRDTLRYRMRKHEL
jgi:DNA-binding protein Fis